MLSSGHWTQGSDNYLPSIGPSVTTLSFAEKNRGRDGADETDSVLTGQGGCSPF
jgi:hypothetical protein